MPYNSLISRSDVAALIPEDVASGIIDSAVEQSAALSLFPRVTMSRAQQRMPVLSALPVAYFVNGDTGLKQTTEMAWANKYLNVEEIAAIVPVPEAVLDDSDFSIWGEVRPRLAEAIGRVIDNAIFFGVNAPGTWPTDIVAAAVAAGNAYARGTATQAQGGIAEDVNQLMGLVEADGFDVNGFVTRRTYRSRLRGARDTSGQKLMDLSTNEIEGAPVRYTMAGMWPSGLSAAEMIAGDWTKGMIGIRQDLTWRIADQAVLQDGSGVIQYNLFQQDMVALRVVMRLAWQVANPINYEQQVEANRYPFAVLRSPAA
jgi:HK97 family phage major capsid protein